VVEPFAREVGLVRIPAHTDVAVTGRVHDGFDVRQQRGLRAVHFEPDLHAVTVAELAQLAERLPDLFQRFFRRHFPGDRVGPDFDAGRADVVRENDVFL